MERVVVVRSGGRLKIGGVGVEATERGSLLERPTEVHFWSRRKQPTLSVAAKVTSLSFSLWHVTCPYRGIVNCEMVTVSGLEDLPGGLRMKILPSMLQRRLSTNLRCGKGSIVKGMEASEMLL